MRPPSCRIATPDRARTDPQLSETHLTCARVACHRPERGRESHGEREREDKQQDVRRRICLRRRGGSAAAGRLDAAACPSARGCQRGGNGTDGGGSSGPTPAARLSIRHTHRGPSRNSPPAHPARHARRSRHAQPSSIAVATGPPKAATRWHCAPISCPRGLPPSRDPPQPPTPLPPLRPQSRSPPGPYRKPAVAMGRCSGSSRFLTRTMVTSGSASRASSAASSDGTPSNTAAALLPLPLSPSLSLSLSLNLNARLNKR